MTETAPTAREILEALPGRLHGIVDRWAEAAPDAPALAERGTVWSYRALAEMSRAAADWLAAQDVRAGDRILLVNENSLALAALIFGASRLDAWPVLLNARLSPREVDLVRDHCAPRRVLYTAAVSPEAASHADRHGAEAVETPFGALRLGPLDAAAMPEPVHEDSAEQIAVLIYTTGTTGMPKGVMLSHRSLLFVAALRGAALTGAGGDRAYGALPISHIYGLASVFLRTLDMGACCALEPRFSPEHLANALATGEITILQGVPAMHARLLEYAERAGRPIAAPRLRLVTSGGAPLDADLKQRIEAAFGLPLVNGYGLTETAATVSRSLPAGPGGDLNTGPPAAGVELRIVAPGGEDAPAGETGEIWIRGPSVMLGYYRDPEATAEAITAEGWYRSGDVGRIDGDGNLHVLDRAKELIIRSGFNVSPVEVEGVLNAHPGVTVSAVVGRPGADGNEEIIAFVQPASGGGPAGDELAAWAGERLAPYKKPTRIVLVDELPAAASGKVLKAKLKIMAAALD